jgi:hypothetical protein
VSGFMKRWKERESEREGEGLRERERDTVDGQTQLFI